jgi:hypothetical protein
VEQLAAAFWIHSIHRTGSLLLQGGYTILRFVAKRATERLSANQFLKSEAIFSLGDFYGG